METLSFNVTIELCDFEDPQDAGEWLEEQLEQLCTDQMLHIHDFEIDPNVQRITYTPQ